MTYRARIFDFDGTLADTGTLNLAAGHAALCRYSSVLVPRERVREALLIDLVVLRQWLAREYGAVLRCTDAQFVAAARDHWVSRAADHIRPLPTLRLAREAAARGLIAVASANDGIIVRTGLTLLGMAEVITTVIAREDVTALKPAPDAYLTRPRGSGYRRKPAWPTKTPTTACAPRKPQAWTSSTFANPSTLSQTTQLGQFCEPPDPGQRSAGCDLQSSMALFFHCYERTTTVRNHAGPPSAGQPWQCGFRGQGRTRGPRSTQEISGGYGWVGF